MRVTVHTTVDRGEGHALVAMLRGEGLEVELVGVVDAARIGVGETALPLRIEVAAGDEARARAILAEQPLGPTQPSSLRKKGLIALGVPVVWPGLGHVYAGRPCTGVTLGLAVVVAMVASGAVGPLRGVYPVLLVIDAFFAFRAVKAFNAKKHQQPGTQVLVGMGFVALAFFIVGAQPMLEALRRAADERELARVQVTCGAGQLVATNVGDESRDVELAGVSSVRVMLLQEDQAVALETTGARRAVLAPGSALTLTIGQGSEKFTLLPLMHDPRSVRVDVIVRRVGTAEPVRGTAYCAPSR